MTEPIPVTDSTAVVSGYDWLDIFRRAVAPALGKENLLILKVALATNDPQLIQGTTLLRPGVILSDGKKACGACFLVYPELKRVLNPGDYGMYSFFDHICCKVRDRLGGDSAALACFLNTYDEMPRDEMRRVLLDEIERYLLTLPKDDSHGKEKEDPA